MKKVWFYFIFLLVILGTSCGKKAVVEFEITSPQRSNGTAITLTPSSSTSVIEINNPVTITATKGTSPYTLSVQSGTATIDNSNLQVTPTASGTLTIKVTDADGNTGTVSFEAFETKSGAITASETWSGFIKIIDNIWLENASTLTVSAGTKVHFEKTGGGEVSFGINNSNSVKNIVNVNGTSANPVTIKSIDTTVGYFTSQFYPGSVSFSYTNFTNIGSASRDGIESLKHNTGDSLTISNSTFTSCGQLTLYAYNTGTISFTNNTFVTPLNDNSLRIEGNSGTKTISNNKLLNAVVISGTSNVTFSNNVLTGDKATLSLSISNTITIENNLIYYTGTTAGTSVIYADRGQNFTIKNNFIKGGGRLMRFVNYASGGSNTQTATISGNILEGVSTVPTTVYLQDPGDSVTIKDNYFIGNAQSAVTVIQLANGRTGGYIVRNNTFNIESSGTLHGVFSYSAATSNYLSVARNNLFILDTGSPYGFRSQNNVANEISAPGATNNYFSFAGSTYQNLSNSTTGTNDQSGAASLQDATVTTTNFTSADAQAGTTTRASLFNTITTALTPTASSTLVDAGSASDNADALTQNGTRDIGAGEYTP